MSTDGAAAMKTLGAMKTIRQPHERVWKDAFSYTYPIRGNGFDGTTINAVEALMRAAASLVDPTSTEAARDLSANIMGGMTPANSLWFDYKIDGIDQEGKTWLSSTSRVLWENIHASNFDSEGFESVLDGVIAGWSVLYVDDDKEKGGFSFEGWPISTCYIAKSKPTGPVDIIIHEYILNVEQTVNEFGIDNVSEKVKGQYTSGQMQESVNLMHYIYPRKDGDANGMYAKSLPFASCHYESQAMKLLQESGYHEFPCIVPRWMKIPGCEYATGPIIDALPAIKRLNELCRMELSAADLAVAGMWIGVDDGILNPRTVKVGPRKIIIANDVNSMKELKSGADFNVTWTMQEKMQAQIKRIMM